MNPDTVARRFSPGYIVAAYAVSYIGAWTAVELLCRRTANRGFYNWFVLIGSALAMGGIAIWGMHLIGNRAEILADGAEQWQLVYNPGYTTVSFFLPIIVLIMAFLLVASSDGTDYVRVVLAGLLNGLGVSAMHYLGQAGIANYECLYDVPHVVGAAIIGITASIMAMGVFAYFRSSWDTRRWSRMLCAVNLATAMCGTHWVASVGTAYRRNSTDLESNSLNRNNNSIGVIVLSVSACVVLLLVTILGQQHLDLLRNKDQQIAIAVVIFDEEGKIMITPDGYLPHRRITSTYLEKSSNDVFGISHPLFTWMFRTSFYWDSISPLIPAMREHLEKLGIKNRNGSYDEKMISDDGEQIADYALIFKELFCVAAAELADDFHLPLDEMGVLYDDILTTGWDRGETDHERRRLLDMESQGIVSENSGGGQLLFLTKSVDIKQAYHLQSTGYRFASIKQVIKNVSQNLQSNENVMAQSLARMRDYIATDHTLERGVHLACFTIRATMRAGAGGFEILARKDATNLLPTMHLPLDRLEPWQYQYLSNLDGQTVASVLKLLRKASLPENQSIRERVFAKQIYTRLEVLQGEIEDPLFYDACLVGKPIEVPCRGLKSDSLPGTALIIAFQIIVPVQARAPGKKVGFVPVNFFKMQQFIQKNSTDHAIYSLKTYREFAFILGMNPDSAARVALVKSQKEGLNVDTPVIMKGTGDKRTYVDSLFELCVDRK